MTSICLPTTESALKRSKYQDSQIVDQQEKISNMILSFYEKVKVRMAKSLTKYQNKNTLLCKELFQSLSLHPKQQLYETIKLHDIIFNQIHQLTDVVTDFLKRVDSLQQKLKMELFLQNERLLKKKQKEGQGHIKILRKVSFKRQKHTLKNRLVTLDTINKKILKCQEILSETLPNNQVRINFEIEGKKSEIPIQSYNKIWFESKNREYLLCLGSEKEKKQYFILNDKLQTIAKFQNNLTDQIKMKFIQLRNFIYFISSHRIHRMNICSQEDKIEKCFIQEIVSAETRNQGIILWVKNNQNHHMVLFLTADLILFWQIYLKLNVSRILSTFQLGSKSKDIFFITISHSGQTELFKIIEQQILTVASDLGTILEVIPVKRERIASEIAIRLEGNKFIQFTRQERLKDLYVEIQQGYAIKSCVVLGQILYALSQNGKSMLECMYEPLG